MTTARKTEPTEQPEAPKPPKRVKYTVLRGFDTPSGTRCEPGDEVQLSPKEAADLLTRNALKES